MVADMEQFLKDVDSALQSVFSQIPLSVYNAANPTGNGRSAAKQSGESNGRKVKRGKAPGSGEGGGGAARDAKNALHNKLREKVGELRAARRADDPASVARLATRKRKREEKKAAAATERKRKARKLDAGAKGAATPAVKSAAGVQATATDTGAHAAKARAAGAVATDGTPGKRNLREKAPESRKAKRARVDSNASEGKPESVQDNGRAKTSIQNVQEKAHERPESSKSQTHSVAGDIGAPGVSTAVKAKKASAIEIGSIAGFEEESCGKKGKRRKHATKLASLEKELTNATASAERAKDAEAVADENVMRDSEMKKAVLRAQGIKVKDQAGKLRKTIRKEKRRKEKSREEWAKRTEAAQAEKTERQQKREERLKERREKKASKGTKGKPSKGKSKPRK